MGKTREAAEAEMTVAICYGIMKAWEFDYHRRLEWEIFGSRARECPDCGRAPNMPCVNLADLFQGKEPRINKRPHANRIDWRRVLDGLKFRGYYKGSIENQVRRRFE